MAVAEVVLVLVLVVHQQEVLAVGLLMVLVAEFPAVIQVQLVEQIILYLLTLKVGVIMEELVLVMLQDMVVEVEVDQKQQEAIKAEVVKVALEEMDYL